MAIPVFTAYPNSVSARATFAADMDQMISEFPAFIAALNALGVTGGVIGIPYTFSTTTADADPGAGLLRLNHATQNLATVLRADLLSNVGSDWTTVLDTFDDSTSTVKGQLGLVDLDDGTKFLIFNVTAVATPSGYRNITVAAIGGSAASPFADGASLLLTFTRTGDKGTTGDTGAAGVSPGPTYTYSTTTASADPGAGFFRLNHATLASATALYISETDANASSIAGLLATWDDSTNTAKGTLRIEKLGDPSKFAVYTVTGSMTDNGTWDTFALTYVAGTTLANNDSVVLSFARAGDAGASAASGLVLLATTTASGAATVEFTSNINTTYDEYEIHLLNVYPSSDNSNILMGASVNGGSSYLSGSEITYAMVTHTSAGGSSGSSNNTGNSYVMLNAGLGVWSAAGGSGTGINGIVRLIRPASSRYTSVLLEMMHDRVSGGFGTTSITGAARIDAGSGLNVNAVKFYPNGGTLSGEFKLYGVRKTV